jgi:hypothetical protein
MLHKRGMMSAVMAIEVKGRGKLRHKNARNHTHPSAGIIAWLLPRGLLACFKYVEESS